jgi:phage terminase large subunit-like protein
MQDFRMDEERGRRVVAVFETGMRQSIGRWARKPFTLFDWQRYDLTIPLFGWVRPDGFRRFKKSLNWTPKKNGKSGYAGGLGLTMLVADGEYSPEVYCSATTRAQAGIIHKVSRDIAKNSPAFASRLKIYDGVSRIVCPSNGGVFAALSSESKSSEGLNWHAWLCDEIHVNERALVEALEKGGIAREQSLLFAISTAGIFDPFSIGWQYWEHSQQIHTGALMDPSIHTLVYAADNADDFMDPAVHKRANPSLDLIVPAATLMAEAEEAKSIPTKINAFKRYNLNVWVQSSEGWMEYARWARCGAKDPTPCRMIDGELVLSKYAEKLRGRRCFGGLDLSSTRDLTAAALWFPPRNDKEPHQQITLFWLPGDDIVNLGLHAKAPYGLWCDEGWLHLTEGDVVDYQAIRQFFNAASQVFHVEDIGYDRHNATSIVSDMVEDGLEMVVHSQGFAGMSPPIKEMESLLSSNNTRLLHENHPVLNWNIANAQVIENSNGDRKIIKQNKAKRMHIDGLIANLSALWRVINDPYGGVSVYESRGMLG